MKRVFLLILTNLAIMLMLGLVVTVTGAGHYLTKSGINLGTLLAFSAIMGFGGSFISLALSKQMAKWSTGCEVITSPRTADEAWLVETVRKLSSKAGIAMPEVAIYDGEPNAFATGMSKNSSLVAVSTGLLSSMSRSEVEAVLAHEVSHAANGDMVTLTLVQGVMNTFVYFLSRVVGNFIDNLLSGDEERTGPGIGYMISVFILDLVFGLLASFVVMWVSRRREYAADAGAAGLMGSPRPMISALRALEAGSAPLPSPMAAFGISGGISGLFASHPSIEERIAALETLR